MNYDNVLITIEVKVQIDIFNLPKIKTQVDTLLLTMEDDIMARFNEIKDFITQTRNGKHEYKDISYDEVTTIFKIYFYKSILNKAVKMQFTGSDKYNVVDNILEMLSYENLKNAILGKPMIDAFSYIINKLPVNTGLDACLHGSTSFLLEKQFLDISLPY